MNSITADLDNIDNFVGSALSDQIWRITDKVNQWLSLAQSTIEPAGDQDLFDNGQNVAWAEEDSEVEPPQPQSWENEEEAPQPAQDWDEETETA